MRVLPLIAWPPAVFQPAKKQEEVRRSKAAEQALKSLIAQTDRAPSPRDDHHDDESDDPPNEKINIVI
jgi:hypothetical protein